MSRQPQTRLTGVLVVDDSAVTCAMVQRLIESDPTLRVVGRARDGVEALEKIAALQPDVVMLDFEMPRLNGLETLKRVMRDLPRPVLMLSRFTRDEAEVTLEALELGAFDYIPKPQSGTPQEIECLRDEIVAKVKAAASSCRLRPARRMQPRVASTIRASRTGLLVAEIVCIGTSTGGPTALQQILPRLPCDLPAGILVVLHMPPGFTEPFARRMDDLCQVSVRQADHGEPVEAGVVYVAPAGLHMTLVRHRGSRGVVQLSPEPAGTPHRPSVDVTMMSVAEQFQARSLGIILTGMGCDGVRGMKAIREAGGQTIGQDESTCAIYGMPRACAETGVLQRVVPLSQVADQILLSVGYSGMRPDQELPGLTRRR
jgi:two-component system chemotaxis response regulator CheB